MEILLILKKHQISRRKPFKFFPCSLKSRFLGYTFHGYGIGVTSLFPSFFVWKIKVNTMVQIREFRLYVMFYFTWPLTFELVFYMGLITGNDLFIPCSFGLQEENRGKQCFMLHSLLNRIYGENGFLLVNVISGISVTSRLAIFVKFFIAWFSILSAIDWHKILAGNGDWCWRKNWYLMFQKIYGYLYGFLVFSGDIKWEH